MSTSHSDDSEDCVFFWSQKEEPYGFMSQFFECSFEHEGTVYRSAEMWMMVQKARLFGDEEIAQEMLKTTEPRIHQSLGRKVKNYDQEVWDANKSRIVEEGNHHKFTKSENCEAIKKKLLETGERELVEASPTDKIWGIGHSALAAPGNREYWGQNLLGKAIMAVRRRIRDESQR